MVFAFLISLAARMVEEMNGIIWKLRDSDVNIFIACC